MAASRNIIQISLDAPTINLYPLRECWAGQRARQVWGRAGETGKLPRRSFVFTLLPSKPNYLYVWFGNTVYNQYLRGDLLS